MLDILTQDNSRKELEQILGLENLNLELLAKIHRCLKKAPSPPSLSSLGISN